MKDFQRSMAGGLTPRKWSELAAMLRPTVLTSYMSLIACANPATPPRRQQSTGEPAVKYISRSLPACTLEEARAVILSRTCKCKACFYVQSRTPIILLSHAGTSSSQTTAPCASTMAARQPPACATKGSYSSGTRWHGPNSSPWHACWAQVQLL